MSGYLGVMEKEEESIKPFMARHLQELMTDMELYSWESARVYHAVWLQQLENGQVPWDDMETKLQFRNSLVCMAPNTTCS